MACDMDLACLWREIFLIREKMTFFQTSLCAFSLLSATHLQSYSHVWLICVYCTPDPVAPSSPLSLSSFPHFPGATVFLNSIQLSSLITSMKISASIIPLVPWSPFAERPYAFESSRMIQQFMVMRWACSYDCHCAAEFREWVLVFLKSTALWPRLVLSSVVLMRQGHCWRRGGAILVQNALVWFSGSRQRCT